MRFILGLALACTLVLPALADMDTSGEDAAHAYRIETTKAPLHVKKGQQGEARLTVVPRAGAHVSPEAPMALVLKGGASIDLPKQKLGRKDARETEAKGVEFALPVVGKAMGNDELKAQLTFFICTEHLCERQKRDVSVAVVVE